MKNLLLILGGFAFGYASNTETGKKVTSYTWNKVKGAKDYIVDSINEKTNPTESDEAEAGKDSDK